MRSTPQLIETLATDLKPVTRVSFLPRFAAWVGIALAIEALYLAVVGLRSDLVLKLQDPAYSLSLVALLAAFIGVSWLSWREAFPQTLTKRPWAYVGAASALVFAAIAAYGGLLGEHAPHPVSMWADMACCLRMIFGASIPNVILLTLVSRVAPLRLAPMVAYSMLASSIIVVIAGQLNCPFDDMTHVMVGHGAMVLGVNLVTFAAFRTLLKSQLRRQFETRAAA